MLNAMPFDFEMPVDFFEKADAEPGKERRIGGIATLETKDRQGEVVLARGLDFSDFRENGWFNDDHNRATDAILGYPDEVKFFRKGQALPTGKKAPANGHWVEGYLLNTKRADRIWELGQALKKTNRRLGFSVEGKIQERRGYDQKTIAKALVRNVAITSAPVHTGARMEILAKSIQAIEKQAMEKGMGMGQVEDPGEAVEGPKTGMGAGRVVAKESLEKKPKRSTEEDEEDYEEVKKRVVKKGLSTPQIFSWYQRRLPKATPTQLGQLIELTRRLKAQGQL